MMDTILNAVADNWGMATGLTGGAVALWIMKQIPNEKIKGLVEDACFHLGNVITLGLGKWKYTKGIWNKTIEPYFIDLVDNVVLGALNGFLKGLRSDNKK